MLCPGRFILVESVKLRLRLQINVPYFLVVFEISVPNNHGVHSTDSAEEKKRVKRLISSRKAAMVASIVDSHWSKELFFASHRPTLGTSNREKNLLWLLFSQSCSF